jgi:hypothetical protein
MEITMQHVSQKLMIHPVRTNARYESQNISNVKTWSAKSSRELEKTLVVPKAIVRDVAMV